MIQVSRISLQAMSMIPKPSHQGNGAQRSHNVQLFLKLSVGADVFVAGNERPSAIPLPLGLCAVVVCAA